MSKLSSGKAPSKQTEGDITLPFSIGKILAIAPALVIALIMSGIYFSGIIQMMLGHRELREFEHEAKAIEYFNWALSANPNLAEAYSERATAEMEIERRKGLKADYSAARSDSAQAVKLDPRNALYFENGLKIEHAALNFRKEIAGYEHLIALEDYLRESLLNDRAGVLYIVGDFNKARADRDSIIKVDSSKIKDTKISTYDPRSDYKERAEQYRYIGEIDKAIRDYEVCVKSTPEIYDLMHLAYLYENSGRSSQALKIYSKVIEIDSNDKSKQEPSTDADNARYRRANLYLKFGEPEKALADADGLIKYNEECVHRKAFRAKILGLMGRKNEAEEQRKAALGHLTSDINDVPKNADAKTKADTYAARADFYATTEQWKNALKDYAISLSVEPSSLNYSECARIYSKIGDYDNAIKFFTKAISSSTDYEDLKTAYNGSAQVHLSQNKPALAVEDCSKAIALGTNDGECSYLRAKAYRMLGKNELAKIDENEALGLEFSPLPDLL